MYLSCIIIRSRVNRGDYMGKVKKSYIEKKNILEYIEEANNHNKESHYRKALDILQKALTLGESIDDLGLIAKVHNNMGKTKFYLGNYDKAMEHYMLALPLYEKLNNKKGTGNVLLNIGSVYALQEQLENALKYFNQSLELCKSIDDKQGVCFALNNAATIYRRTGEKEKAKNMFLESAEISKTLGDKVQLSKCLSNIGLIESDLNNHKNALEYSLKALQIEKELNCKRTLCFVLFQVGEAYFALEDSKNMHHYLKEALQMSKEANQKHVEMYCCIIYYTYYEKIEDYKEALKYYKLYSKQNEIIFHENRSKAISELQIKYDIYKNEKEKEIYRLKNIELLELNKKLQSAYKELENLHKIDYLTKLYNRKAITEIMDKELFIKNNESPFIICIADIDDFKKVNDIYGHTAGDRVLSHFSNILKQSLRKTDYIGRWGGEEFLILLPNTNLEEGTKIIKRLRKIISDKEFNYLGQAINITMSFGYGCFNKHLNMNECINQADKCLYKGKNSGKNCINYASV